MVSQIKHIIITVLCIHLFEPNIASRLVLSNGAISKTSEELKNFHAFESCGKPVKFADTTVQIISDRCFPNNRWISRGNVAEFTVAQVTCAHGYLNDYLKNESFHVCHNREWSPPITACAKICDKLKPKNVELRCIRNRTMIDNCNENSVLLAGTTIRPKCKSTEITPDYFKIICNKDGKWDNQFIPPAPEYGKPCTETGLLAGRNPELSEVPWHAAIFNADKELICGGTIITENVIVTGATCFGSGSHCNNYECEPNYCNGTKCVEKFEVVVGKYHRNYTVQDRFQKTMKIKEIRFSEKGFFSQRNHYAADIALLILQDRIFVSHYVKPAPVNWEDLKNHKYPSEDAIGKAVGWGMTENGTYSAILQSVNLSYVSHRRCVDMLQEDSKKSLTFDKFCANTDNCTGSSSMQGNGGEGVFFEDKGLFYLRGVASLRFPSHFTITAFTDLSHFANWILSVCNITDQRERGLSIDKSLAY